MEEYGVTDKGFVIKRLDKITESIHQKLSEGFGFNTRVHDKSFLDVMVTSFSEEIALLWEESQETYYALSPGTATGISLDNAVQFSGITRERAQKTSYRIHCRGDDGTYVATSTIASNTMPKILLDSIGGYEINRKNFHELSITVVSVSEGEYTVTLDGVEYVFIAAKGITEAAILKGLSDVLVKAPGMTCEVSGNELVIKHSEVYSSGSCELSNNLTTGYCVTIAKYETQKYGAIKIPNGIISEIVTNVPGLDSVTNMILPTLGRLRETDIELRQSNLAKSAIRSTTMVDSVTSYLLNSVNGVVSARGYENYKDEVDAEGRPPHCIEILVDGGEDQEVAEGVLLKRSGGIRAYGTTVVPILTENGDIINIGFSRPELKYAWIKVTLHGADLPGNAAQIAVDVISAEGDGSLGESIYLQEYFGELYKGISGLRYVDIAAGTTDTEGAQKPEYTLQNISASYRQKIMVDADRIEVIVDDS